MTAENQGSGRQANNAQDLAQAFQELAKGERAASALENHLSSIEKKIDELLAGMDPDHLQAWEAREAANADASSSGNGNPAQGRSEKQEEAGSKSR
ncbi:hypothetical protein L228DRAFT_279866 [Xylona heveae TC161]|uniref:Uncharacterized protein n=1 Tax=Xylona heveae (strain CBS 132557 / TC161) TaxID=1328760 RepID=A0A165JW24_XYLHT|nr:hypothetical protein L228DRAFT_279866 [Xylona heveae TC161]KZF26695.1 hypothetical protein L228DRAFT_279866 [Xylona heveae TC161]